MSSPTANETRLLLGTSSWTADGWVGSFYPDNCKPQDFLRHYAKCYSTVEIDSTFYRIPTAQTVKQWKERTPEGFTFAAKVPQSVTHERILLEAENDLNAFLKIMDILGDKLGPLLLQFPYFNKQKFRDVGFFLERLEPFLKHLPKDHLWAIEIRNKNWLSDELYTRVRQYGVALALVDQSWMPRPHEYFEAGDPVTADFSYIRWLGDRKGIEEQTTRWNRVIVNREREIKEWLDVILRLIPTARSHLRLLQ